MFRSEMFVVALAFVATCACKTGNDPIGPTPPITAGPKTVPGTQVQSISVPDSAVPIQIWLENVEPGLGGQLVVGQSAWVAWNCSGPNTHGAFITTEFLFAGRSATGLGVGSSVEFGSAAYPCGFTYSQRGLPPVTADTPNVTGVKFYVWVSKGRWSGAPVGPPDAMTSEIPLNWRAPVR